MLFAIAMLSIYSFVAPKQGSESGQRLDCLANPMEDVPQLYNSTSEMEALLTSGSVDVTQRFDLVLEFGFILYILLTVFAVFLLRRGITNLNETEAVWLNFLFLVVMIVQYVFCIVYRYDHLGKVCSGEYLQTLTDKDDQSGGDETDYSMYFIDGKAVFLWWQVNLPWMALSGAAALGCVFCFIFLACLCAGGIAGH